MGEFAVGHRGGPSPYGGKLSFHDKSSPGPDPERLEIDEEDWEEAVKKALRRGKPDRWPEEETAENREENDENG